MYILILKFLPVTGSLQLHHVKVSRCTRISAPIEGFLYVAVTLLPELWVDWTMCEWNVPVTHVVEEMDLITIGKESSTDGMYWSIAPSFVEEST